MATLSINPMHRVTGHLKVAVEMEGGKITTAHCSGTAFRGWELIMSNRDITDMVQLAQRMCTPCSVGNSLASAMIAEQMMQLVVTANARRLRNIVLAVSYIQSHIHHFYRLTMPDYMEAPATGPLFTGQVGDIRIKGNEAKVYHEHYWLADQAYRTAGEMLAIFGGKFPHMGAQVPGGWAELLNAQKIIAMEAGRRELLEFINQIYLPDVQKLMERYPEALNIGKSAGNFLAFGAFPRQGDTEPFLPDGVLLEGQSDVPDLGKITEDSTCAWYQDGGTNPTQSLALEIAMDKSQGYSWVKAPRYAGKPMEVGPLARMLFKRTKEIEQLGVQANSVMGRHLARVVEAQLLAKEMGNWLAELNLKEPLAVKLQPVQGSEGAVALEMPGGTAMHWVKTEGNQVISYNIIAPATWNVSPRDAAGQPGPVEGALQGLAVPAGQERLLIGRVVRSFDPCLDCAVH